MMMKDKSQLYGNYVIRKCSPYASPQEKMEIVKWGIDRLCKKMQSWDIIPDFDTMQFIVHEDDRKARDLDWYTSEKEKQNENVVHIMTVAIKYNGLERK